MLLILIFSYILFQYKSQDIMEWAGAEESLSVSYAIQLLIIIVNNCQLFVSQYLTNSFYVNTVNEMM